MKYISPTGDYSLYCCDAVMSAAVVSTFCLLDLIIPEQYDVLTSSGNCWRQPPPGDKRDKGLTFGWAFFVLFI